MNIETRSLIGILFLFWLFPAFGQEQDLPWQLKFNGYLKDMQTAVFSPLTDPQSDQLLHNRLNFKLDYRSRFSLNAGIRNRVFIGSGPRTPGYKDAVAIAQSDWWDMSWTLWEQNGFLGLSEIDRLYIDYSIQDWQLRIGRQRINWGINTIWNPHDIFNAYAFTDFDYEERPGADAVLIRKYWGFASQVEFAVAPMRNFEDWTMGMRLRTNWKNYDWQWIAGKFQEDAVVGFGWAGALGNVGFKGEFSYFAQLDSLSANAFVGTLSAEYVFSSGLFVAGGLLYNSNGSPDAPLTQLFQAQISAKNLYPYESAVFVQGGYTLNPLSNLGLAIIYSPNKVHPAFLNPSFTYSIASNWDIDLIGQIALQKPPNDPYQSLVNALFLRLKWSF